MRNKIGSSVFRESPSTFRIEGSLCVVEIIMADGGKKLPSINCFKCCLKYNEDTRTPRTLPCNHTLCKRCIQDILDQSEGHLKCPLCGKQHEVPCTKDAEAYPVNEDKLMIIKLLQENEKEKKPKRSQDQENQKDSQSRSKGENEGLKAADKEKDEVKESGKNELTAKESGKNELTEKSSRKNEGTLGSSGKNEKTAKGSGNNEGTARSSGNNDGKARSSGKNEPTAKGSVKNAGTSGPTGNSNNDKQPKDGDGNNDKAKSKCEKTDRRACEIYVIYLTNQYKFILISNQYQPQ